MSDDIRKQADEIKKIVLKIDERVTHLLDEKMTSIGLRLPDIQQIIQEMLKRLKDFLGQLGDIEIITKEQRNGSVFIYKTVVKMSGDIENEFPSAVTQTLWDRHNSIVDDTIKARKNALIKIIEMLGEILKSGD